MAKWEQLYDLQAHKQLLAAIAREVSLNYANACKERLKRNSNTN
jgi:hypothetical protein